MEKLLLTSSKKIRYAEHKFSRYLLHRINWDNRLLVVKGARGVGKTTLLLQHAAQLQKNDVKALYVAMDDLYFMDNNLLELAEKFVQYDGKVLLLDEVHKYPNWSREIKLIYDNIPELKVIFTSSSLLEIYKAESDLSRRAVSYDLKELSFREFITFKYQIELPVYGFEELLNNHVEIAQHVLQHIKPIPAFQEYLQHGLYPYFKEGIENYHDKLRNTINLIIDLDMNATENLDYRLLVKIKKLLYLISTSVPFTPNISKLSEAIGVSRPTLIQALHQLEKARLIIQLSKTDKGIGILTKPDKLFLNNTNLAYALASERVNTGNNRESFFAHQLEGIVPYTLAEQADFFVDNRYTFEIGGKNKGKKQIAATSDAFVVKDDIEMGIDNLIPLWLFGFLY